MADPLRGRTRRGVAHRLTVSARAYDRDIGASSHLRPGSHTPTYGLDIETDTTVDGLDPVVAPVVAVAVTGADFEVVLDDDEPTILRELDVLIASLPPGVLVTWNGGAFDLPFLADRARVTQTAIALDLALDPSIPGRHEPLNGHDGAYRARWHGHAHLDGYQLFRADVGASLNIPCGLKPLARLVGLPVIEVDRERIHELSDAERRAYVASDAHLARALVARRPQWTMAVDPFPVSG